MAKVLFKGPMQKVLPDGFDEKLIEAFLNGSERAVAALAEADAPAEILTNVTLDDPIPANEPFSVDDGGGAKPSWAKKGGDTTTTSETTDDSVSSGGYLT